MNNEVKQLFEQTANLLQMPTMSNWNKETKEYTREFLKLDFASCYGGYNIRKVLKSTGEDCPFGETRLPKKEMIAFLRGMIAGLCARNNLI